MFDELAFVEVDEATSGGGGVGVVGDHDDGFFEFLVEALEEGEDVGGAGGVEVAGGFVGEDEVGVGDDGAGDGDALFLAAGELAGEVVEAVGEADEIEGGGGIFAALFAGEGGELEGQLDVFEGVEDGDEVEGLEDEAEVVVAPAGEASFRHCRGFFAEDDQASRGRPIHAGDQMEQRRLSGTRGAH